MFGVAISSRDGKCNRDLFHLPARCLTGDLDVGQISEPLRPLLEGIKMDALVQACNLEKRLVASLLGRKPKLQLFWGLGRDREFTLLGFPDLP